MTAPIPFAEERCKEQTGPSQTHGTSNYKGYVTSVPGFRVPGFRSFEAVSPVGIRASRPE